MELKNNSIKSGFSKLDEIIGGFLPSEVTIVGSRPAIGKTSFILDVIKNICTNKTGKPLLFSIEKSQQTIKNMLISKISGESNFNIRKGTAENKAAVEKAEALLAEFSLIIDDTPDIRIDYVVEKATKCVREEGCNIIFIDYLELLVDYNNLVPVAELISNLSRKLKNLARSLNVPIVITCQVNCSAEGDEPDLKQLRSLGMIEQNADVIVFIHMRRGPAEAVQERKLIVAKNHNDVLGQIDVNFHTKTCTYNEKQQDFVNTKISEK